MLLNYGSKKSWESTAPFSHGQTYGQSWIVENRPAVHGSEVVVTTLSLTEDEAELKNLCHQGKMVPVKIKIKDIGTVAVAAFGEKSGRNDNGVESSPKTEEKIFPFKLTETQPAISYVHNKKVK